MKNHFKLLSLLLVYPEQQWYDELPEMAKFAVDLPNGELLLTFFEFLQNQTLLELQENYVTTFDRNKHHALHLFEHLYGEDRERGQAMVDLLHEYQNAGFEPEANELPDYLPLFIEFLSLVDFKKSQEMLGDAVHVIAHIWGNLQESESPYAAVLEALVILSPIPPEPLKIAPVRDMDEAMELFGPSSEGVEPLLKPTCGYLQQGTSLNQQSFAINLQDVKHQSTIRG